MWAQEKLCSGFMLLSVLRSVPELHLHDSAVNRESVLVGDHRDPAGKPNYVTEAWNKHCSGKSFVLADGCILFSNTNMQHVQHYADCGLLGRTHFCHMTTRYFLSREWVLNIRHTPRLGSPGSAPGSSLPRAWMWTECKEAPELSSVSVLSAEMNWLPDMGNCWHWHTRALIHNKRRAHQLLRIRLYKHITLRVTS